MYQQIHSSRPVPSHLHTKGGATSPSIYSRIQPSIYQATLSQRRGPRGLILVPLGSRVEPQSHHFSHDIGGIFKSVVYRVIYTTKIYIYIDLNYTLFSTYLILDNILYIRYNVNHISFTVFYLLHNIYYFYLLFYHCFYLLKNTKPHTIYKFCNAV